MFQLGTMDPMSEMWMNHDEPPTIVLVCTVLLFSNKCFLGFHSSALHLRSRQSDNFTVPPEALMFTSFGEIRRSHLAHSWFHHGETFVGSC